MYYIPTEYTLDYRNFAEDLVSRFKAYVRLFKIRRKGTEAISI